MSQDDFERFGVPAENIRAAEKWAKKQRKRHELHTRVPTRKEVRDLPPNELSQLLVGWMVHSAVEIIPSRVQIALVLEVLSERSDVAGLGAVLSKCRNFIEGH